MGERRRTGGGGSNLKIQPLFSRSRSRFHRLCVYPWRKWRWARRWSARWNTIARFLFELPRTARACRPPNYPTYTRKRTASGQNSWPSPPVSFYDVIFSNSNLERTQHRLSVKRFRSIFSFLPSFLSSYHALSSRPAIGWAEARSSFWENRALLRLPAPGSEYRRCK